MVSMRTIAIFLIACSAILFVIAVQKYYSAIATAQAIAERIEEIEFESAGLPIETTVCGLAGVMLLVAGLRLLYESRRQRLAKENERSLS